MSADIYCQCGRNTCVQCSGPITAKWASGPIVSFQPTRYPWLYDTAEYLVATIGVQVGEATDETLSFLIRHYVQDSDLMRAVVGEMNRRERL